MTKSEFTYRLQLMAQHLSALERLEPGSDMRLSFWIADPKGEVVTEVRCEQSTLSDNMGRIWDTIYINGQNCGNRCGGRNALVGIYADGLAAGIDGICEGL